ncbi:hypothetical protein [Gelidibacter maritimus]|uniref:Helicase/UvrB N-terminal domain-containing protein n=1 Tax=Gelidibacter maritimus TaxID=2761487 RepID=A0A7W2M738_9FLAO|nr:hypothetical protein [Gelidibacter maritimus]MBA6153946.1 hypothetical protein [Gelidibacter maritimus]
MKKVKVYDQIMGSGKTYDAIERMLQYQKEDKKYIYITPFLSEISRVQKAIGSDNVFVPLDSSEQGSGKYHCDYNLIKENGEIDLNAQKSFKPLNKRAQFLKLASDGKNIISTHSLFMSLKKCDFSFFSDYILILDEVVTPLQITKIGAVDINMLRNQELIIINDETNEVNFINDNYNDPGFTHVKKLCNNSTVFYMDKYFFVWVFPIEIFTEFKEVQILTYLFEGSLLRAYFKMYGIGFNIYKTESLENLLNIRELLNIYQGSANSFSRSNAFSKTWIENLSKEKQKSISDSTSNIFKRVFKTGSEQNAYTTFKSSKSKLAGKGYTKGFIPVNARASNEYSYKESMAYLANRYFDPQTINFFRERDVILNEDLWALSELIQWVWRGCIRRSKEMNLFIPSNRMRQLLVDWLDGKFLFNMENQSIENSKTILC